jgi:hypothetical protein
VRPCYPSDGRATSVLDVRFDGSSVPLISANEGKNLKVSASVVVALALLLSACGGGGKKASKPPQTSSTPPVPQAPATATATPPPTAPATTESPTTTAPPAAGGGEEPVHVPATFIFKPGGRVSPPTVTVPAFIAVEITLASRDGRAHALVLNAGRPYRLAVGPGGRSKVKLPGLRAGTYRLRPVGGGPGATLVAGGEAGP